MAQPIDYWQQKTITMQVNNCARCGDYHHELEFVALSNPPSFASHFAQCPTMGQPILLEIAIIDEERRDD